jgi:hypothetical protein
LEPARRADWVFVSPHVMAQFSDDQPPGIDRERSAAVIAIARLEQADGGNLFEIGSLEAPAHEPSSASAEEMTVAREELLAFDGRDVHWSADYEARMLPQFVHQVTKHRMRMGRASDQIGGT